MSHRHVDSCDPNETYGMPSRPCDRCRGDCCVDCSTKQRDGRVLCEWCVSSEEAKREQSADWR